MGRLTVVGTGIMFPSQMTLEAADRIREADIVLYNVGESPVTCGWLNDNARATVDLYQFYSDDGLRTEAYEAMVNAIVAEVEAGKDTVAAFYGHPGVFVGPGYEAVRKCRTLGYEATMLPGVSAADCMFSDLEFDPARYGCTMVEATDYVLYDRQFSVDVPLIIWQAGTVADITFRRTGHAEHADLLQERLLQDYPANHTVFAYMASTMPGMPFHVEKGTVGALSEMRINAAVTCLVPPLNPPRVGVDGTGPRIRQIIRETLARAGNWPPPGQSE